jgi:hypothetical protein
MNRKPANMGIAEVEPRQVAMMKRVGHDLVGPRVLEPFGRILLVLLGFPFSLVLHLFFGFYIFLFFFGFLFRFKYEFFKNLYLSKIQIFFHFKLF